MTTPRQRLKSKLANREPVIGAVADFPAAGLVEFLGSQGFDVVFIDCEHAGPGIERVADMVREARLGGIASILRPWSTEPGLVRRFLDCGVDGLIAPEIESAGAAQAIVDVIVATDPPDAQNIVFAPLIESRAGVDNADAILRVEGVDAIMVGTSDLAVSLGLNRRGDDPRLREATFRLLEMGRALGKSVGAPSTRYGLDAVVAGGANVMFYSARELLKTGAAAARTEWAAANEAVPR